MIGYYKPLAITKKNISRYSFLANTGVGVNMLKYLNDSSVVYRLLQSASIELENTYDYINHTIRFDYNKIPNNSIDAINIFNLSQTPIYNKEVVYLDATYGYSKYTGNIYNLLGIQSEKEFTRCSYPCDIIFTSSASGFYNIEEQELILYEGKDNKVDKPINNTRVTIRPVSGFIRDKLTYIDDIIYIKIEGFDISNNKVEEVISIQEQIDYRSYYEYSFIDKITSIGNSSAISIGLFPYIIGEVEVWKNQIVDREYADEYKSIATVNMQEKELMFFRRLANQNGYPDEYDLETRIQLDIGENETIYNYLIDTDEELVYIVTSSNKLYCFPLIIPYQFDTTIDKTKTAKQSIKVTYINDIQNEEYIFTLQPISKTNDVELLNIYINDVLYEQDILLDLYRERIEENTIRISYDSLFSNNQCIIRFETTGSNVTTLPIYLFKEKSSALFIKDLSNIKEYQDNTTPSEYTIDKAENTYILSNFSNSTFPSYNNPAISNVQITEDTKLYKFSSNKNIVLDNYIISLVYNSFYFNTGNSYIVTHDSITSIRFDNSNTKSIYNSLDTRISNQDISGRTITGYK